MHLSHLSLTNFRNFARLDIDIPGGPVLLVGGNAQGKTSFLEAVYYLATFSSFHATNDRQLINFLADDEPVIVSRIVADFQRTYGDSQPDMKQRDMHRLELRLILENSALNGSARLRKEVLLDGVKRKMGETIGAFYSVLFLPHMLRVVEGPPEERRRYLNLAMGQVIPRYASILSEYNRTITQRNALLKQLNERGGDLEELAFWDEHVASLGAQIIHARIHAVQDLERVATRIHNELTRGGEVLRLSYQPAYDPITQPSLQKPLPMDVPLDRRGLSQEVIRENFLDRLKSLRNEEIRRGMTTIGPHRDELRFQSNGMDLGIYGSRGQGRTVVLSLKLAEVAWMREKTGQWPVLLLDEVLAELDGPRREDLLSRLAGVEQALMTTTDLDLFSSEFIKSAKIWRIEGGQVEV
jgi:DNA replication and repair protein RecF